MRRIQEKTKRIWANLFAFLVIARSMDDIIKKFGLTRQQIYNNIERMNRSGFTIRRTRKRHEGGGSLRVELSIPLSEALERLGIAKEKYRVSQKEKPKKQGRPPKQEPPVRDVSAAARHDKAPWFVLTTECERLYFSD